jgi:hypothetical protein
MSELHLLPDTADDWVDKCWGKTRTLIDTTYYSKHELMVRAGGYCSLHYHKYRANSFTVTGGCVDVVMFMGPILKRYRLDRDNNKLVVPSLVPHMFMVVKDGIIIEEYFSDRKEGEVQSNDIYRIIEGGRTQVEDFDHLPMSIMKDKLCMTII